MAEIAVNSRQSNSEANGKRLRRVFAATKWLDRRRIHKEIIRLEVNLNLKNIFHFAYFPYVCDMPRVDS